MGLIKLEPAVLRRAAKDLNQSISQLGSVNNLIQSVAPEIEYNWQSEYTPEYLECLEALRQNTRKIRMELEDIEKPPQHCNSCRAGRPGSAAGAQRKVISCNSAHKRKIYNKKGDLKNGKNGSRYRSNAAHRRRV